MNDTVTPSTLVPEPGVAPPLRWGVIGTGWPAGEFGRAAHAHTRSGVVAVGSRDQGRARELAERWGARAHDSYRALVEDPQVDAVYIATPHSFHRDHALLAIAAGKHVLVEKPFMRNGAEAREVLEAARAAGVFAMEAMWTRFLPHMAFVRSAIERGLVGEVVGLRADHGQAIPFDPEHRMYAPSLAGGALLDVGVYTVAFALDLLGPPTQVRAVAHRAATGVDDATAVVMMHESGALSQLFATARSRTGTSAVVDGTEGRVEIAGDFYKPTEVRVIRSGEVVATHAVDIESGFEYQIAAVARAVAEGAQESELMSWRSTLEVADVMDAIRHEVGVVYPGEVTTS